MMNKSGVRLGKSSVQLSVVICHYSYMPNIFAFWGNLGLENVNSCQSSLDVLLIYSKDFACSDFNMVNRNTRNQSWPGHWYHTEAISKS
uniref:Uncharacterized protein n=1 Tax=Pyxicephalus adspersus TaxID=30357 RepID=A0AAV3A5C3_PYXAD|nr:TPA: hypothetical protein GDO54_016909 [Pyxicephalus adspersus]